jgi:hypothetical protein
MTNKSCNNIMDPKKVAIKDGLIIAYNNHLSVLLNLPFCPVLYCPTLSCPFVNIKNDRTVFIH